VLSDDQASLDRSSSGHLFFRTPEHGDQSGPKEVVEQEPQETNLPRGLPENVRQQRQL
jgi:hypothetical protein